VEECSDHGESRDWWRRCSDSAERGGRQETVIVLLQAYTINKYDMHKYAYLLIVLRSYP
jgi:hypothetical protein